MALNTNLGNIYAQVGVQNPNSSPQGLPANWAETQKQSTQDARMAVRNQQNATNPYYSGVNDLFKQTKPPQLTATPAPQYDPAAFTTSTQGNQGGSGSTSKTGPSGMTINYDQNGNQLGAPTYGQISGNYNFADNPNPWAQSPQTVPDWTKIEDPYARLEWKIRSGYPTPLASHANTVGGFDPPGYQDPYPSIMGPQGYPIPQQWADRYGSAGTQGSQGNVGSGSFTPMQGGGGGVNLPAGFNALPTNQSISGIGGSGLGLPWYGAGGTTGGPASFPQNLQQISGLPGALQSLLGPLAPYVDAATSGLTKAYQNTLADQMIGLQSRFAGEGSYLSSPMFAGMGELGADLGAQYLSQLGQMQLGAAEGERGRQTQTALGLANMLSEQAKQAMASGATVEAARLQQAADFFRTQATYASDIYRTQSGTAADLYRTQGQMYGNELQYALGNAGIGVEQQRNILQALLGTAGIEQQGNVHLLDAFLKIAQSQQGTDQNALSALLQLYNMPGEQGIALLNLLAGIPNVSKQTGPGLGYSAINSFLSGLGQAAGGGIGTSLGGVATQGANNVLGWFRS